MGILPLEFMEGEGADRLGLNGTETFDVSEVMLGMDAPASQRAKVTAHRRDGSTVTFECLVRIDTATEGAYMAAGGILPYVLDQMSS
jgi:aconitate hydratase